MILSEKRFRYTAIIIFILYTIVYLLVTQFIVLTLNPALNPAWAIELVPNWTEIIFRMRAAFLFESIGYIQITPFITFFISVPNLILAFLLSYLVAMNLTVSYWVFRKIGLRGGKGAITLIGTIPALLGGAACCVPTLILVFGLQFTATLSAVWPWFVPLSFALLILSLWWALKHAKKYVKES